MSSGGHVMPQLVPHHNWSPRPSAANYVTIDGPLDQLVAAMDGSPTSKPAQGG